MAPKLDRALSPRVRPLVDSRAIIHDTVALRERAKADGYLFFRRLLDPANLIALRHEVLGACRRRGWLEPSDDPTPAVLTPAAWSDEREAESLAMQAELQTLPGFHALRSNAALHAILERVLGAVPQSGFGDVVRLAPPATWRPPTSAHQDQFFTRSERDPWTVWIPLGECPASLGGLAVAAGSHAHGLLPHAGPTADSRSVDLADARWSSTSYHCGDVLMFHALTVHRARPNLTSNALRVSVDFRFAARR